MRMPDVYRLTSGIYNSTPQTVNMPRYRITDTFSRNLLGDRRIYLLHLLKHLLEKLYRCKLFPLLLITSLYQWKDFLR